MHPSRPQRRRSRPRASRPSGRKERRRSSRRNLQVSRQIIRIGKGGTNPPSQLRLLDHHRHRSDRQSESGNTPPSTNTVPKIEVLRRMSPRDWNLSGSRTWRTRSALSEKRVSRCVTTLWRLTTCQVCFVPEALLVCRKLKCRL